MNNYSIFEEKTKMPVTTDTNHLSIVFTMEFEAASGMLVTVVVVVVVQTAAEIAIDPCDASNIPNWSAFELIHAPQSV